jgi:hypothetical protein
MKIFLLIISLSLLTSCSPNKTDLDAKKSSLLGEWKIAKTLINERESFDYPNRTIEFHSDNTLNVFVDGDLDRRQSAMAKFSLMDEENIVVLHQNVTNGEFWDLPYRYKFSVKNDTLHITGFWVSKNGRRASLTLNEEWWVKVK